MFLSCSDVLRQAHRPSRLFQEEGQQNGEADSEQQRRERRLIEGIDCDEQPRDRSRPRPD